MVPHLFNITHQYMYPSFLKHICFQLHLTYFHISLCCTASSDHTTPITLCSPTHHCAPIESPHPPLFTHHHTHPFLHPVSYQQALPVDLAFFHLIYKSGTHTRILCPKKLFKADARFFRPVSNSVFPSSFFILGAFFLQRALGSIFPVFRITVVAARRAVSYCTLS